jgi:hypothetical protein
MKDLASSLPSTDEIIRALGLHNRRLSGNDVMPSLALFGAGILVGAGLALLFAPSTGRELREELAHKATDLADRVTGATDSATAGDNGKAAA